MRILFDSKNQIYKSVFGCLRQGENCAFRIDIPTSCLTKNAELILEREDGNPVSVFSLRLLSQQNGYDLYGGDIAVADAGLYFYYFRIRTQNECFSLYKYGYDMTNIEDGAKWQLSVLPLTRAVPEEYAGKVMYQIFPDRFCKCGTCDTSEKLRPFTVHENESDVPSFAPDSEGKVTNSDFFGGNLRGIAQKLPYLKSLGVSLLYLNPIFKAYSNHRYDTADYHKIDEMLGTEADFAALCRAAHENGIKIILDGVFSHTGSNSVYFDQARVFGNGACSSPDSPYRRWYDFQSYPDRYTAWWGIETLPCVNETEPTFGDFMFDEKSGVIAHWLKKGCDGFRLDVADELPDEFIRNLNRTAKKIKPESLVIGEVWEDASNKVSYGKRRTYFTGDELDSVMNYPFKNAILGFVSGADGGEGLRETVMTVCENYPADTVNCLMNFLSTHDTARVMSVLGHYERTETKQDRAFAKMSPEEYDAAKEKLFCAVFLQFVLPGMSCIYYGDEIGMEGFEDPFCRRFMQWERTKENDILDFHRRIAHVKNECAALQTGRTDVQMIRRGVIRITRAAECETLWAYCNVSDQPCDVPLGGAILLEKNTRRDGASLTLGPHGFVMVRF